MSEFLSGFHSQKSLEAVLKASNKYSETFDLRYKLDIHHLAERAATYRITRVAESSAFHPSPASTTAKYHHCQRDTQFISSLIPILLFALPSCPRAFMSPAHFANFLSSGHLSFPLYNPESHYCISRSIYRALHNDSTEHDDILSQPPNRPSLSFLLPLETLK